MKKLLTMLSVLAIAMAPTASFAAGGSGWSFGGILGLTFADQTQMNELIKRANTREGGISTSELSSAYEAGAFMEYRFSFWALHFRPTFFYQSEEGSAASGGDFNYSVTGYTFFPMVRFYMLESPVVKAYSQLGIGFGMVDGAIEEQNDTDNGQAEVEYSAFNTGYMFGLGFEFCLINENHCFNLEGNYRWLSFPRVVADSGTGVFESGPADPSLSQGQEGKEIEFDGEDLAVRLSGVQGLLGYTFHF